MDDNTEVLLDTCVLINFATIGRVDLLRALAGYSFLITEHVRDEVKEHFTTQYDAVTAAVEDGSVQEIVVDTPEELADFALLTARRNLGDGECSAIAAAKHRSLVLAMDDRRARNKAVAFHAPIQLLSTAELVVLLIQQQVLSVQEADDIKADWEQNHRFKLPLESFGDQLDAADE